MYIDGTVTDTEIIFSLRDRYGNISNQSAAGTLKNGDKPPQDITFTAGVYTHPRSSGYWRVEVPSLESNTLKYEDNENEQTTNGVVTTENEKEIK